MAAGRVRAAPAGYDTPLRFFHRRVQREATVLGRQLDQVAQALRLLGRAQDLLQDRPVLGLLQGDDLLPVRERVVDPGWKRDLSRRSMPRMVSNSVAMRC